MAVSRTILPRKGLIQSQHGLTGYEADQDANWALLDASVAFMSDLPDAVLTVVQYSGVLNGFALSTSSTLTPGIAAGVLVANGSTYATTSAPAIPAAPAGATSYLFYNINSAWYWGTTASPSNADDALVGSVTTSSTAVTSVLSAAPIFGVSASVPAAPSAAGNFTLPHPLGRTPNFAVIEMTNAGSMWFQNGMQYDSSNLYLVASDAAVTAVVKIW
jgi:hypothetical protein